MTETAKITTTDLREALKRKHPAPQWAVLEEVRNATGWDGNRSADALMFQTWPSQGLELHGVEIKASRADLLRELKQPEKADSIARYCDRWWILAPPEVCQVSELPASWGLMVLTGRGISIRKPAAQIEAAPITRAFLASLFRQVANGTTGISDAERRRAKDAGRVEGHAEGREAGKREAGTDPKTLLELQTAVDDFEERSGITINKWDGRRIGDSVARFIAIEQQAGGVDAQLETLVKNAEQRVRRLRKALSEEDD